MHPYVVARRDFLCTWDVIKVEIKLGLIFAFVDNISGDGRGGCGCGNDQANWDTYFGAVRVFGGVQVVELWEELKYIIVFPLWMIVMMMIMMVMVTVMMGVAAMMTKERDTYFRVGVIGGVEVVWFCLQDIAFVFWDDGDGEDGDKDDGSGIVVVVGLGQDSQ